MELILSYIVVGLIAGWIAGLVTRGHGFGFVGNIVIGILGAIVGGLLFNAFGGADVDTGDISFASVFVSTIGAVVFLWIISLVRSSSPST